MKKLKLSAIPDGGTFFLSKRKEVSYTRIIKERDGIVITSNNSTRSFKKPGATLVFIT